MLSHVLRCPQPAHLVVLGTARDTDPDSNERAGRPHRRPRSPGSEPASPADRPVHRGGQSARGGRRRLGGPPPPARRRPRRGDSRQPPLRRSSARRPAAATTTRRDAAGRCPCCRSAPRAEAERPTRDLLQVAAVVGLEFGFATVIDAASVSEADGLDPSRAGGPVGARGGGRDRPLPVHACARAGSARRASSVPRGAHESTPPLLGPWRAASAVCSTTTSMRSPTTMRARATTKRRLNERLTTQCAPRSAPFGCSRSTPRRPTTPSRSSCRPGCRTLRRGETIDLLIAKGEAERKYRAHGRRWRRCDRGDLARDAGDWDRFASAATGVRGAVFAAGVCPERRVRAARRGR